MDRLYIDASIEELERLVTEYRSTRVILAQIREELAFRTTARAQQLLREVTGLLDGEIPPPHKARQEDTAANQLPLMQQFAPHPTRLSPSPESRS